MLYPIFEAIEDRLSGLELTTEWYNVQYDGTIIRPNGFFVEFPEPVPVDPASKQLIRSTVRIRIHYYSKVVQTQDGIANSTAADHETIAKTARDLIRGYTPANGSCKRLQWVGWRHWHRWKGWMVTFIEFEAKKEF